MKRLLIILSAITLPVFAQDDSKNLLNRNISFQGSEITVEEFFDFLSQKMNPAPNIVFQNDAGEQKLQSLNVKDVRLGNLFRVIERVTDVEISIIDDNLGAGDSDPFAPASSDFLSEQGIVLVGLNQNARPQSGKSKPSKKVTEVIPVKYLSEGGQEQLLVTIERTWERLEISPQPEVINHPDTKLLIFSGSPEGVEIAQKIAAELVLGYKPDLRPRPSVSSGVMTPPANRFPVRPPVANPIPVPPTAPTPAPAPEPAVKPTAPEGQKSGGGVRRVPLPSR